MSIVTKLLLALMAGAVVAAVWAPGLWWQWLVTAAVLLIAAAASDLENTP